QRRRDPEATASFPLTGRVRSPRPSLTQSAGAQGRRKRRSASLPLAQAVDDLADRVELEVRVLLAEFLDGLVGRDVAAAERTELAADLVVADALFAQEVVLGEEAVHVRRDEAAERVGVCRC